MHVLTATALEPTAVLVPTPSRVTASINTSSSATPAMPSATTWCSRTNQPMRSSDMPVKNHISHSGRDRSSARRRSRATARSSSASSAGASSRSTWMWSSRLNRGGIDPQRAAEAAPGYVEHLTKPREEVQPAFDRLLRRLDPEATVGVEETAAVEDTQRTDVLRPHRIRPQDQPIFGAQPLQRRHLTSIPKTYALGQGLWTSPPTARSSPPRRHGCAAAALRAGQRGHVNFDRCWREIVEPAQDAEQQCVANGDGRFFCSTVTIPPTDTSPAPSRRDGCQVPQPGRGLHSRGWSACRWVAAVRTVQRGGRSTGRPIAVLWTFGSRPMACCGCIVGLGDARVSGQSSPSRCLAAERRPPWVTPLPPTVADDEATNHRRKRRTAGGGGWSPASRSPSPPQR